MWTIASSPEFLRGLSGFLLWLPLGLFLNFFNKWALSKDGVSQFNFPIAYTICHMVASFIGTNLIFCIFPKQRRMSLDQFMAHKYYISALAVCTVLNVVCSNASLVEISLFVNQIIKSLGPVPALIGSCIVEGKRYSWMLIASIMVLCLGAILATPFGSPEANAYGLFLASVSCIAASSKPVFSAKLMAQSTENGLTPLVLVFYDAAMAAIIMICIWPFTGERASFFNYLQTQPSYAAIIIGCGSGAAFLYNVAVYYFTMVTSALVVNVSGDLTKVILILGSAVFVEHWGFTGGRLINWGGVLIFFVGLFWFSHLSLKEKRANKASPASEAKEEGAPGTPPPPNQSPSTERTPLTSK